MLLVSAAHKGNATANTDNGNTSHSRPDLGIIFPNRKIPVCERKLDFMCIMVTPKFQMETSELLAFGSLDSHPVKVMALTDPVIH